VAIDHRPEARTPHPTYVSLPYITFLDFWWRPFLGQKFVGVSIESSLCPGTGSGCRLEGGVNRRIKIITLKLKFLLYSKTRTQWSEEPFE
jgi:hypothetical protein